MRTEFLNTIPVLPSADIQRDVQWYREKMGLNVHMADNMYAVLYRANLCLHLQWHAGTVEDPLLGGSVVRIFMKNIQPFFQELQSRGAVTADKLKLNTPWQTNEFGFYDLNRNAIFIMEEAEPETEIYFAREATVGDVATLAELQVATFIEAFPNHPQPPSISMRKWHWAEQFKNNSGEWFCIVAEDKDGKLVGFVKGQKADHQEFPEYNGELNRIYILKDYFGKGIATKLFEASLEGFKSLGASSFVVFGAGNEPLALFYEKMKGNRIFDKNGTFQGVFGWKDI